MTPLQWLLVAAAVLLSLWFLGVRPPRVQGSCPWAGTGACGCSGMRPAPRASEDLLTRS